MFIKICGTTTLADAQLAVAESADALGFIFAPSKRQVTAEQAARMTAALPRGIEKVGVFATSDIAEILRTVRAAGLTALQLHQPYDPTFVQQLDDRLEHQVKLWQVVGVEAPLAKNGEANDDYDKNDNNGNPGNTGDAMEHRLLATLHAVAGDARLSVLLLDTVHAGASGGLGIAFSWNRVRSPLQQVMHHAQATRAADKPLRLILAGGLRPENVAEAIQTLAPWGVDVVSGVEQSPGRKSPARLQAFVRAARAG